MTLQGLARRLDEAEASRRKELHGVDDRVIDPVTAQPRSPRSGYTSADPWYDGRAHGFTIVDSPRAGTELSVDRLEELFLHFGESATGKSVSLQ